MIDNYQSGFEEGFRIGGEYAAIKQFFLDHPVNRLTSDDSLAVRWERDRRFPESSGILRQTVTKRGLQILQQEADRNYQRAEEIESEYPFVLADGESEVSRSYLKLKDKIDELMGVAF